MSVVFMATYIVTGSSLLRRGYPVVMSIFGSSGTSGSAVGRQRIVLYPNSIATGAWPDKMILRK